MRLTLSARAFPLAAGWRLGAAVLALVILALLFLPSRPDASGLVSPAVARPVHPVVFFDDQAFVQAIGRTEAADPAAMTGARAVILPHHWLAGHLILGSLRDLAASGDCRRIILIGPNHVNAGGGAVITSDLAWQTPFGLVEPDGEAISRLTSDGVALTEPSVLTYEHSVAGIVPAIAYYLPDVRVVPLVLRSDVTPAEVETLATALAPLLDEETALIAAVDFSHYLSAHQARQNDRETLEALRSLDSSRILSFSNEHLDSPASIAVVMETMRLLGATEFELRENINSSDLGAPALPPVTSYVAGYYR
jgi:AmmeMemoRadiSam system protein B